MNQAQQARQAQQALAQEMYVRYVLWLGNFPATDEQTAMLKKNGFEIATAFAWPSLDPEAEPEAIQQVFSEMAARVHATGIRAIVLAGGLAEAVALFLSKLGDYAADGPVATLVPTHKQGADKKAIPVGFRLYSFRAGVLVPKGGYK